MLPTVSIVILCFNHEKYIREAIESVLNQSFRDIEIILVDDGSKDSSVTIAREFKDERLRSITKRNGGPSDASEVGIRAARAPLIAWMSADDVCHVDRIKIQLAELEGQKAGVVFCRPHLINEDGKIISDEKWPVFFKKSFTSQAELYSALFNYGNFICATSMMFRAELIKSHGYLHHGLVQLQDFLLLAHWASQTKFHLSEFRYLFYRIREGGGNLSSQVNQWRTQIERTIVYRDFFGEADRMFLNSVFGGEISLMSSDLTFSIQKARLLLRDKRPFVTSIGAEKLIDLLSTAENCESIQRDLNLTVTDIYKEIAENMDARTRSRRKKTSKLSRIIRRYLRFLKRTK